VDLLAGQTKDIGDVLIWNDDYDLHVKFVATSVCLEETHLHVADSPEGIPQTKKGNPIPGKFEYSDKNDCVYEKEYVIPLNGWTAGTQLYIAAHASTGTTYTMSFVSAPGHEVYGPIYTTPDAFTDWGTAGSAVRAFNWLGYTRDIPLADPQIPGCTTNPYSSLQWSWGFGMNSTYTTDIPGVTWISTDHNTEVWNLDSWRRFVKTYEVPGEPILAKVTVNADNYYMVSNDTQIGSDSDIFNGPETYEFGVNPGFNTLEFVTKNEAQGNSDNSCDQLGNPNGLTYKATIRYTGDSESAWGAGEGFSGANWAMYFIYTVQQLKLTGYGVVNSGSVLNYSDGGWAGWSVPSNKVVLGGGFNLTGGPAAVSVPGTPGSVWPHYTFSANEYGWVVRDAQDGASSPASTLYAVYADMPAGYEIVTSSAMSFSDTGYGGWSCPAGKVVLGGGFESTGPVSVSAPGTPGSVWPHYTFGADEYGWVVRDAPDGTGNTITVYAICADPVAGYEVVTSTELTFSDTGYGGWSCPADKVVTGGGFDAERPVSVSAPGTPGSVWPHYTFGPDEYGWVLQSAPDGFGSTTTVYAICAVDP
jgi:hypothetical protein